MKIITLWQPWASFIAWGLKTIETREHGKFRILCYQTIGIHAGKSWDKTWEEHAGKYLTEEQIYNTKQLKQGFDERKESDVRGSIICTVNIYRVGWLLSKHSNEALIDCDLNRFGLFLNNLKIIEPVIPDKVKYKCHQGIWDYDGEIIYLLDL